MVVPYNDGVASAKEIEARAGDPNFIQVLMYSRTGDPIGNRRYWPIYEAAEAAGLPIGIHAFGESGYPVTSSGWASSRSGGGRRIRRGVEPGSRHTQRERILRGRRKDLRYGKHRHARMCELPRQVRADGP